MSVVVFPIFFMDGRTIVEVRNDGYDRFVDAEHYALDRRYRSCCGKCGKRWFKRAMKSTTYVCEMQECCGNRIPKWPDVTVDRKLVSKGW